MRRPCECVLVNTKLHPIPPLVAAFPTKFPVIDNNLICIPIRVYEDLTGTQFPPYCNATEHALEWYTRDSRHEGWKQRLIYDYEKELPSDLSITKLDILNDGMVPVTGETLSTEFTVEQAPTLELLIQQIRDFNGQDLWSLELKNGHPQSNTVYLWTSNSAFLPGVWNRAPIGPELIRLHNGFYHGALREGHKAVLIARYKKPN